MGAGLPVPTTFPELVALGIRYKYLIAATTAAIVAMLVAPAFLRPRTYTANASFILTGARSERGGLGAVAAELGLSIPAGDPARSPAFYADLLTTRAVLQEVVRTPFEVSGRQTNLIAHYRFTSEPPPEAARKASEALRKNITVRMESQTGIVTLGVTAVTKPLAEQIAGRLLEELNKFNLQVRKSQAVNERRFAAERYDAARRELLSAEQALESFLARNRGGVVNSPQLAFQRDRLERDVALRQRVFASLAETLERARIEEVRDTPVITVIDDPAGSSAIDRRGTGTRVLLGLVLGLSAAVLLAMFIDALRASRGSAVAVARTSLHE
jgi:uncharacterized protein involved in exopolysaccharide biosynthesis